MIYIAISQRVSIIKEYNERRDCIDQQWVNFLLACGMQPVLVPNNSTAVDNLLKSVLFRGIILTGGNDLVAYGGDAPERDEAELMLLEYSLRHSLPLIGVCRGMQLIQHYFGVNLEQVDGHVAKAQVINIGERQVIEDSYHRFGAISTVKELSVWATADDGVIKAIRHTHQPIMGVMWHPERKNPFSPTDIEMVKHTFLA